MHRVIWTSKESWYESFWFVFQEKLCVNWWRDVMAHSIDSLCNAGLYFSVKVMCDRDPARLLKSCCPLEWRMFISIMLPEAVWDQVGLIHNGRSTASDSKLHTLCSISVHAKGPMSYVMVRVLCCNPPFTNQGNCSQNNNKVCPAFSCILLNITLMCSV